MAILKELQVEKKATGVQREALWVRKKKPLFSPVNLGAEKPKTYIDLDL